MEAVADGVEVALTDIGVEPFDMTKAPDANVDLPAEQRRPAREFGRALGESRVGRLNPIAFAPDE